MQGWRVSGSGCAFLAAGLLWGGETAAETTPMETALPDDQVTTIACEYHPAGARKASGTAARKTPPKTGPAAASTRASDKGAKLDEDARDELEKAPEGTYHYQVYVPRGYSAGNDRRYPCLLIADAGGDAKLGNAEARVKQDRWIAVMLVESKNESDQWLANFLAAHDDAVQRLRINEDMKFATGLSGGARCASQWGAYRSGFRGLFLQGAGYMQILEGPKRGTYLLSAHKTNKFLLVFGAFGKDDSNRKEIERLTAALPASIRYKFELFDGGHEWAPAPVLDSAFDWFEEETFLDPKQPSTDRMACLWYAENRLARYDAATEPVEKYDLANQVLKVSRSTCLKAEAAIQDRLPGLRDDLKKLAADPAVKDALAERTRKGAGRTTR